MSRLKGDEEVLETGPAIGGPGAAGEPDGRAAGERLAAWGRLMLRDASLDEPEPAAFFLTTSREAFESAVETATGGELADPCAPLPDMEGEIDGTTDWRDRLDEHLNALVRGAWAAPAAGRIEAPDGEREGGRLSLSLVLIPDKIPGEIFGPGEKPDAPSGEGARHILLGLVES